MRKRCGCYGTQASYAAYGLTRARANTLLKECRAGKHADMLQVAAQQAEPYIAKWIILSIREGRSLHDMEVQWELGRAEIMPCCRNSFYAYRKAALAILNDMLTGGGLVQDGRL